MSDLIERLQGRALNHLDFGVRTCREAAARITELEAQLAEAQQVKPVAYLINHETLVSREAVYNKGHITKNRLTVVDKDNGWTETPLYAAPPNTAALIEQGRRAGIEEAARYVQANYPFDKRDLVPAIRALLTPARDTKADSDGDDGA